MRKHDPLTRIVVLIDRVEHLHKEQQRVSKQLDKLEKKVNKTLDKLHKYEETKNSIKQRRA